MRKVNYAAYVKGMMSQRHCVVMSITMREAISSACSGLLTIDIQHIEAYLYLRYAEATHGERKTAGSEERGAGARRRAQSQSRSSPRCSVRRQSILRCEGPRAGALRDGAAPPGRRRRHQRGGRDVRRYPADLLQSPECAAGPWTPRSVAEPARSQRRPQGLPRGDSLRGCSQSWEPRTDDFRVSRRSREALRRQGAPAQPGAGAGGQKKRIDPV
jgi:hypothetical protein